MDHYHIWVDLRPGNKDTDFSEALQAMLGHMRDEGMVEAFNVQRRKLGFGPDGLGEWHIDITTRDLAQLDAAFHAMAPRSGKLEKLHAAVWSKVTNYKAGLYRDFPDAERR